MDWGVLCKLISKKKFVDELYIFSLVCGLCRFGGVSKLGMHLNSLMDIFVSSRKKISVRSFECGVVINKPMSFLQGALGVSSWGDMNLESPLFHQQIVVMSEFCMVSSK